MIARSSLALVAALTIAGCGGGVESSIAPAQSPATESSPNGESAGGEVQASSPPRPRGTSKGSDRDGDGLADNVDQCPDVPEDFDGFQDDDGCPDPDNDLDGIPDTVDKCPNEPETKNGFDDDDGCPDFK